MTHGLVRNIHIQRGRWVTAPKGDASLRVDIHESDVATIDYRPASPGRGRFYLGFQPRDYFEDPSASEPVDNKAEAQAFAAWANGALGSRATADDILPLLAEADVEEPEEDFVEDAVKRLIALLGLALPEERQA